MIRSQTFLLDPPKLAKTSVEWAFLFSFELLHGSMLETSSRLQFSLCVFVCLFVHSFVCFLLQEPKHFFRLERRHSCSLPTWKKTDVIVGMFWCCIVLFANDASQSCFCCVVLFWWAFQPKPVIWPRTACLWNCKLQQNSLCFELE